MKKLVSVMLILMFAVGIMATAAFADATFSASAPAEVAPGEEFTVAVSISGNEGFDGGKLSNIACTNGEVTAVSRVNFPDGQENFARGVVNGSGTDVLTGDGNILVFTVKAADVTEVTDAVFSATVQVALDGVRTDGAVSATTKIVPADEPTTPPECDHDWGEGAITKDATCTEKGVKTFTCSKCGETKDEEIDMIPHTPAEERVNVKEPTETEKGYTGDVVCAVCGAVIEAGKDIDPIGPTTCKHENLTAVEAVAATCEKDGFEAYWKCDDCNKFFSDEKAENEIEAPVIIPKLGHEWDEGKAVVTKEPTCTEKGEKTFTCSKCGETKVEEIDALGHKLDKVDRVEATKDKEGNIEYYKCSVCGKLFKDKDGKQEIQLKDTIIPIPTPTPVPTATAKPASTNGNPRTGDESNIALYAVILVICAGAAITVVAKKKSHG